MNTQHQNNNGFIPANSGFRNLKSYQKAEIIYDGTVYFTKRFFDKYDRTVGQMVQAARSGKQNIAEGSVFSATSKETEIKLTNVARASLVELQIDYEDFLRINKLQRWGINHPYSKRMKELNSIPNATYATYAKGIENDDPEICANVMIGLICVTVYLLNNQIKALEQAFLKEGGLRESMTRARLNSRRR